MKESQLGFEYSWSDVQPVRALVVTITAAQIGGAILGLLFASRSSWILNLWFGGAVATFPAFLVGLYLQAHIRPGSIAQNHIMVRRIGLIALLLSIVAVFMPVLGFE